MACTAADGSRPTASVNPTGDADLIHFPCWRWCASWRPARTLRGPRTQPAHRRLPARPGGSRRRCHGQRPLRSPRRARGTGRWPAGV